MEIIEEQHKGFTFEFPKVGDELAISYMHIQAWKETYIVPESGLTEAKADELLAHLLTNTDIRTQTIKNSLADPEQVLYRLVKNSSGAIVGFLHGSKDEQFNVLEAIYLLNEAKGKGIGSKCMEMFLAWADTNKPSQLEVFTFNTHAINFYSKYSFARTDRPTKIYKELLPYVEMVRPNKFNVSKV